MARSRNTDPETSYQAAAEAEGSGRAKGQRTLCLGVVRANPGLTAAEIAKEARLERHVPSRRLPELRDVGYVHNGESRICPVTNRNSMTWFAGPKEKRQKELF